MLSVTAAATPPLVIIVGCSCGDDLWGTSVCPAVSDCAGAKGRSGDELVTEIDRFGGFADRLGTTDGTNGVVLGSRVVVVIEGIAVPCGGAAAALPCEEKLGVKAGWATGVCERALEAATVVFGLAGLDEAGMLTAALEIAIGMLAADEGGMDGSIGWPDIAACEAGGGAPLSTGDGGSSSSESESSLSEPAPTVEGLLSGESGLSGPSSSSSSSGSSTSGISDAAAAGALLAVVACLRTRRGTILTGVGRLS
jgi:hypothetical protein